MEFLLHLLKRDLVQIGRYLQGVEVKSPITSRNSPLLRSENKYLLIFSMPANHEEAISTTTVLTSTTASTVLSSVTSSLAYVEEDEDGQEWRRGRTRSKSKPKQPRPTSVCAALVDKNRPFMPNISVDM